MREDADGATPREEGMHIGERSTPEPDDTCGSIGSEHVDEQAAMNGEALMPSGATLLPARGSTLRIPKP